ncbi:hypothetical protein TWF569_006657 [Orbilia oligospora]|uniref:Uncharacterized protein n=1 Tax=Orbilia oligospora TaxID=2813651 RepID=A0A7C8JAF5_ORBOL|nr:hypothetical protein TWF102_005301 [Orbilia oligospora]KAF3101895.1 hypothetical protein TWF103_007877 [Orbilia oligospora]KAF3111681.1 hypothetical protein TWF706_011424 [Orbilia oligospora]KAF3133661.1 hypothetical protein TWF703_006718 [Orbilia oligospora]KAF3140033.1 hypothetical protein TWF594_006428 [Orbilia oligospora]
MAGSTWFASSDKAAPPIPPPVPEHFQGQSIEDNPGQLSASKICGISKRAFLFLLPIFVLVVVVIALAAGLGIALGRKNSSQSPAATSSITTSTSSPTQTTETATGTGTGTTTVPPTTTTPWAISNGVVGFNYTQVSTDGGNCAPTGWVQEPQERIDYINIVMKGSTYYAESTFGGVGFLSSELIYSIDEESGAASYAYTFSFPPGTVGRSCNSSTTLTSRFVRDENTYCLITWTLTQDCVGQDGVRILAGEYCKVFYQGDLPRVLES